MTSGNNYIAQNSTLSRDLGSTAFITCRVSEPHEPIERKGCGCAKRRQTFDRNYALRCYQVYSLGNLANVYYDITKLLSGHIVFSNEFCRE